LRGRLPRDGWAMLNRDVTQALFSPDTFIAWWKTYRMYEFVVFKPDMLYKVFEIIVSFKSSEEPESKPDIEVADEFLPAPRGTKWEDITITLLAKDMVEVKIKDKFQRFSYHELFMSDKRSGDKPKGMWWFLVHLLKSKGFISRQSDHYDSMLTEKAKSFKAHMKKIFKIDEGVISHYKTDKGYKAKFKTSDSTHGTFEDLLELPDNI
jgi:hypothetical protein